MLKRFPLINSESEKESVAKCPKSIYNPCPSNSGNLIVYRKLKLAMLGEFCITASKDDKISEGDKWQIKYIELKDCKHGYPR